MKIAQEALVDIHKKYFVNILKISFIVLSP
jgi:hypothetical protein